MKFRLLLKTKGLFLVCLSFLFAQYTIAQCTSVQPFNACGQCWNSQTAAIANGCTEDGSYFYDGSNCPSSHPYNYCGECWESAADASASGCNVNDVGCNYFEMDKIDATCGLDNGSIIFTNLNYIDSYKIYQGINLVFEGSGASYTVSNLPQGFFEYSISGFLAGGQQLCTSLFIGIIEDVPLEAIANVSGPIACADGTAQLSVSGGSSWTWSGPNGFASTAQNPIVSESGTYTVVVTGGTCNETATVEVVEESCVGVVLDAQILLQGPTQINGDTLIMRDDLRGGGLVPLTEPYSQLNNFVHVGDGGGESTQVQTLDKDDDKDALVDWVFIEVRDEENLSQVKSTRAALVQRDGDIVDVDGESPVSFDSLEEGDYHVAVRHRNHLGVMTANTIHLTGNAETTDNVDFSDPNTLTYGEHAQTVVSGRRAMWGGNTAGGNTIVFQGNEADLNGTFFDVLMAEDNISGETTFVCVGYNLGDGNMNCEAIFQGQENEIDMTFFNVLTHPQNPNNLINFIIQEQIPEEE